LLDAPQLFGFQQLRMAIEQVLSLSVRATRRRINDLRGSEATRPLAVAAYKVNPKAH
jgi:hypothetical protein